jgi:hypothetical protein
MILRGENRRTRRKTCPSATLSTTKPTWIDPGANPGLRVERPATNDLSHDTAKQVCWPVGRDAWLFHRDNACIPISLRFWCLFNDVVHYQLQRLLNFELVFTVMWRNRKGRDCVVFEVVSNIILNYRAKSSKHCQGNRCSGLNKKYVLNSAFCKLVYLPPKLTVSMPETLVADKVPASMYYNFTYNLMLKPG